MKKFIITEEEKTRILGMHEDHGYNSLNEQNNKGGYTPQFGSPIPAPQLNNKGGYTPQFGPDPKKNLEVLKAQAAQAQVKAPEETYGAESLPWNKAAPAQVVGPIPAASATLAKMAAAVTPEKPAKPALKAAGTSTPSITDKNVLNTLKFDFQYPGDKGYSYAFVPGTVAEATSTQTGTWYAKNNKTGKVFDISKNYPQTAQKLSTQFPNGAKAGTQTPETPVAETPKSENKTSWDDVVKYYEGNKDPKWKFSKKGEGEGEDEGLNKMYDYVKVNDTNSVLIFWDDGTVELGNGDNVENFGTWEWDGTKPVITPPGTAATDIKDIKGKGL